MRRLFSPRWILIHIGLCALTVLLVFLGFWQLQRLEDRRARNTEIELNTTREVVAADQSMGPSTDEWRRVTLTGRYVPDSIISVINRSQDGVAGDNIAGVFESENNGLFLVNRGFIPLAESKNALPNTPLTMIGYVRLTQTRGTLGAIDSSSQGTVEFQRYDLARIRAALDLGINTNYYVQLIEESPSPKSEWPIPVPFPTIDEGPHFSYAMQWFFFAFVAVAGWTVVVVRKLREETSDPAPEQTSA
jgi:cytochrome oxidase assembly protein ShyY1